MNSDKDKNIQVALLSLRSEVFTQFNLIKGVADLQNHMFKGEMDLSESDKIDLKVFAEILASSSDKLQLALENGIGEILKLLDTDFDLNQFR